MLVSQDRRYRIVSYLILAAALLPALVPFLRFNNLEEWDFPGHYAAIWHLENHLLPWPSGWNPYFYCGYPQGLFYPPLAHYVAAVLALAFGIPLAMKTLLAISILLLPGTFYAFAHRFGLEPLRAFTCAAWMTALLFLSGKIFDTWSLGSDLHSMLNVGLFANTLSLPVVFSFFAVCGPGVVRKNWRWAALLLGVLLLLHPLASLVAVVFLACDTAAQWWHSRDRQFDWRPPVQTLSVALLLGAIWVLPYLVYRGYGSLEWVEAHWSPKVQLVVFNGIILALAARAERRLWSLIATYTALANFILIGSMWGLPLQFTRLTTYLFFLVPLFVITLVRSRPLILVLIALAGLAGVYGYRTGELNPRGNPAFGLPDFGPVDGRILSVVPASHVPSFHAYHDLIPVVTRNESSLGLFIEASFNGQFIANLAQTIEPETYVWGTPSEGVNPGVLGRDYASYVLDRLHLFDIRYVYTDLKLENLIDPALARSKRYINSFPAPQSRTDPELVRLRSRYNVRGNQLDFFLYPVGPGGFVQALPYVPASVGTDWKLTNRHWFLEVRGAPVFTGEAAPDGVRGALPGETVELAAVSANMDRLTLKINAAQPVPVLVKMGYSPTWNLTVNGKAARVYRASPSLVLFYGTGEATLEYHRPWLEYLGYALFLSGVAAILLLR